MSLSPYKDLVISFVNLRNPSKQYYIIDTAIGNGWIKAIYSSGKYKLNVS